MQVSKEISICLAQLEKPRVPDVQPEIAHFRAAGRGRLSHYTDGAPAGLEPGDVG